MAHSERHGQGEAQAAVVVSTSNRQVADMSGATAIGVLAAAAILMMLDFHQRAIGAGILTGLAAGGIATWLLS